MADDTGVRAIPGGIKRVAQISPSFFVVLAMMIDHRKVFKYRPLFGWIKKRLWQEVTTRTLDKRLGKREDRFLSIR